MSNVRRGWCGPCHIRCGLLVYFEGDRAVKVAGDPNHPINRGAICSRGLLILEHLYHPDRLNFPLKRIGERGKGRWERISWSRALDEIASKIKEIKAKYGPEAIAFCSGTYRTYPWAAKRFFNLLGSPNLISPGTICNCPSDALESATYGSMAHSDLRNANCIVLWGHAPSESYPIPEWAELVAAKNRGSKIIVVDPRLTREARMADLWLQIRPGTDAALMIGWIRIIIEEELYDREFVEKWTVGFDKLREHVKSFSLDEISKITWVPKDKIVEGARIYATTKPATLTWGLGCDKQGVNLAHAVRARAILRAITGNLDVKGGDLIGLPNPLLGEFIADVEMELNEKLPQEQRRKQLGGDKYKMFSYVGWELVSEAVGKVPKTYMKPPTTHRTAKANPRALWEAIIGGRPYPVRAMIVQAGNPLLSLANVKLVYEALKKLELLVVMDYYMTPTAELADYVLPAASTLERSDIAMRGPRIYACPKAMDPLYERRDDYYLWRELGLRLDQEEYWPWKTIEEACDYRLKPLGITFKELVEKYEIFAPPEYRKYEKYGFGTPSGKVEIYSSILEKLGYDPLPCYIEPPESPERLEIAREYPFILITGGRFMPMYHSELRQIRPAREKNPDPIVDIDPESARRLGISDGDWVWIETRFGRIRQRARLTDEVHPSMVHVQHGWWFPEMNGEDPILHGVFMSNANVLCPDNPEYCSREIGGWPLTAIQCKVYK
ncbi:MAG: molybdopterin-dependent oxidoreductase [Candidatus Bathyarchaeia archaeon]